MLIQYLQSMFAVMLCAPTQVPKLSDDDKFLLERAEKALLDPPERAVRCGFAATSSETACARVWWRGPKRGGGAACGDANIRAAALAPARRGRCSYRQIGCAM